MEGEGRAGQGREGEVEVREGRGGEGMRRVSEWQMKVTSKCFNHQLSSGVDRAFSGGQGTHPEDQIKEENVEKLR